MVTSEIGGGRSAIMPIDVFNESFTAIGTQEFNNQKTILH